MRITERFNIQRREQLSKVFNEPTLVKIWRKIVKKQMRSLDILDLHDYYDFNYRIEERAKNINKTVLDGRYKAHAPLVFKVEKKLGICRHLMLPNPSDALVLQAIVESISEAINKSKPTEKAYYSRDKHNLKLPHEIKEPGDYPLHFRQQWKKFQKDVLNFSEEHKYLVVTDLTNYFDNIGLRELRHIISSRIHTHEVVLDFLFNLIEQLSWNPDYLPTSLKGLPTINLEAPRLLAHAMLFELDDILNTKTKGCFVRWMDDINFGVESVDDACEILGSMNDVLKSRGLALNLGKTTYYTTEQAERHFLVSENEYLDNFEIISRSHEDYKNKTLELKNEFKKHLKNTELQNWSKVTKRFFTVAAKLKTRRLLTNAIKLFKRTPAIRGHITYYLKELGFSSYTGNAVITILKEANIYDDVTLFHISKLVTDWRVPRNKQGREFIGEVLDILSKPKKVFELYCYLWVAAKYSPPNKLLSVVMSKKAIWEQEPFLTRQVVSILPRIRHFKTETVERIIQEQISIGPEDAASVAHNIKNLESLTALDKRLRWYVFPDKPPATYPLSKFLILCSILESSSIQKDHAIQLLVKKYITDPWMKYWLKKYNKLTI